MARLSVWDTIWSNFSPVKRHIRLTLTLCLLDWAGAEMKCLSDHLVVSWSGSSWAPQAGITLTTHHNGRTDLTLEMQVCWSSPTPPRRGRCWLDSSWRPPCPAAGCQSTSSPPCPASGWDQRWWAGPSTASPAACSKAPHSSHTSRPERGGGRSRWSTAWSTLQPHGLHSSKVPSCGVSRLPAYTDCQFPARCL